MSNLQGISPKVPLVYDSTDGPYQLNKNLKQTFSQNLKMLILTMPGERIMVPNFGVGLHGFLFEGVTEDTFSRISTRIQQQVSQFIPAINLTEITFSTSDEDSSLKLNEVRVSIKYDILPYNGSDELIITSTMTN
jgi:phage baseplate assembly protein W